MGCRVLSKNQPKTDGSALDFWDFSTVKKLIPELVLGTTVVNILTLSLPILVLQLYDRIIPQQSYSTLVLLIIGVVCALLIDALVRMGRLYVTGWVGASFEHKLGCRAMRCLLGAPLPQFERDSASTHMERMRAAGRIREFYSGQALISVIDLPFVFLYLAAIAYLGGWLVLVPLAVLLVFLAIALLGGKKMREEVSRRAQFDERRFSFLSETMAGIHSVKTMAMEAMMQRRYEMLLDNGAERTFESTQESIKAVSRSSVLSQACTIGVVAVGAGLVIQGGLTPGALAACIMLAGRTLAPVQSVASTWFRFQNYSVSRRQVEKLFELETAGDPLPELDRIEGAVTLDGVSLTYPGAKQKLFDDLSLDIRPGECIAIQGDSSSGKTTLLGLIGGMLRPSVGTIAVDGHDISHYTPSSVAKRIGYLPQQALLVEGTLLDNITMGDPTLEDRAIDVARDLGLDRVVAGMRYGYDTPVGNAASESLPAGIKQRIAIARALVHDPKVILFDEANTALDATGDDQIREYLESRKGEVTMVLVTHRPSWLKVADRILVIQNGKLVPDSEAPPQDQPATEAAGTALALQNRPQADERLSMNILSRFKTPSDLALCLTALLKAMDWRGNPRQIAEALPHMAESLDLSGLRRIMANLNFTCKTLDRIRLQDIDPRILPCLFLPKDGPAMVVNDWDAARGFHVFNSGKFANEWIAPYSQIGEVNTFRPAEVKAEPAGQESWSKRIFARFKPLLWLALALTIGINLVGLASPLFVLTAYNTVIPSGDAGIIPYLVAGMAVVLGIDWVLRGLRGQVLAFIGGRGEFIFGGAVFQRLLMLPASATEQVTVGSQMARMKDLESLRDMFLGHVALLFYELPGVLVFVIALAIIEPWLVAVILVTLSFYGLMAWLSQPMIAAATSAASRAATARQEFLADTLSKMRAVRNAGAEERWFERFRLLSGKAMAAEFKAQQNSARLAVMAQTVGQITGLAAITTCVVRVIEGDIAPGLVIAAMMIVWRMISPIQTGFMSITTLYRAASSIRQIDTLMKRKVEHEPASVRRATRTFRGEIQFSRVSFRYANDADPAVIGISLKIEPNKVVAIAGPNGAGKSTVLKLVTGLYVPQAGSVRVDNVDIRQMEPGDLRSLVSYAPQRCDIFYGTIAQNMRLAHPMASDDELRWAAEMAGLYDDIMALKDGFETRISDNQGDQLPNGFRQRLSLARAYLKPAPIMLFDEPGNGLDFEGDQRFQAAIQELRKTSTILIVSHRPSHLRLANAVVYMEDGYVRDVGSFDKVQNLVLGNLR